MMGGGVGLIDYDGDGRLDVYLVNGCQLPVDPSDPPRPNKLYRNRRRRHVRGRDRAGRRRRPRATGWAAPWATYDNDGRDDLFVTGSAETGSTATGATAPSRT